jgi:hypothetical protein
MLHKLRPKFPSPIIPPRERVTDPKVRREVEACRRRVVNQAIGRLTGMTTKAADGIVTLAEGGESESVQLRAWRAILADQMAVSRFSDLEHRMVEIFVAHHTL